MGSNPALYAQENRASLESQNLTQKVPRTPRDEFVYRVPDTVYSIMLAIEGGVSIQPPAFNATRANSVTGTSTPFCLSTQLAKSAGASRHSRRTVTPLALEGRR